MIDLKMSMLGGDTTTFSRRKRNRCATLVAVNANSVLNSNCYAFWKEGAQSASSHVSYNSLLIMKVKML